MKSDGIYVAFSTTITGEVYDNLIKQIEAETVKWIESEHGQRIIKQTVGKYIEEKIGHQFGWYVKEDERAQKVKEHILSALYAELFKTMNIK